MKYLIKYAAILLLLAGFYLPANSQTRRPIRAGESRVVSRAATPMYRITTTPDLNRKIMLHAKDRVWQFGKNNVKGHWARPYPNEIKGFKALKDRYPYELKFKHLKSYRTNSAASNRFDPVYGRRSVFRTIPKKTFNIRTISENWDRIHKKKSARNLNGKRSTNVYYFKNIKKKEFTSFSNDYDHIIVTDTLFGTSSFLNTDSKPRREKRSYIKVIANCIVYESPIRAASARLRHKSDYVFSAKKIIFKSPYKNLKKDELNPPPPFITADTNIKIHKDFFGENERILVNRLFIEIMQQMVTELKVNDDWEKDKMMAQFQKYRLKVDIQTLALDKKYREQFNTLCSAFDSDYANYVETSSRTIQEQTILVGGNVSKLSEKPFKYYLVPMESTLVPSLNQKSGSPDMLGSLFYNSTGDSNLLLTLETKLGYDTTIFNKVKKDLRSKGASLEKWVPKTLMNIEEQPLKMNGRTVGRIIPINNQILRLEIKIPDNSVAINKLFPKNNASTFDIIYDTYGDQKKHRRTIAFKVPKSILNGFEPDKITDKFNILESNTLIDRVKVTSQLLPVMDGLGALNHIEISLEFLFDNQKKVFRGPFNFSSNSTFASELEIPFMKHSENYGIKISGKAYYEFGEREIRNNVVANGKFIELEEGIFITKKEQ